MLSILSISYLFLGGVGAGTIFFAQLLDLARAHHRGALQRGQELTLPAEQIHSAPKMLAGGQLAGLIVLVFGILCLFFDLGRTDRVLTLFLTPKLSWMSFGAYALALLAVLEGIIVALRFAYVPNLSVGLMRVLGGCAIVLSFFVMAYTGLLLTSVWGVAFWRSWLLPVLFVLSSCSGGIALLLIVSVFVLASEELHRLVRRLLTIDLCVVAGELIVAAIYLVLEATGDHQAAVTSAMRLLQGDLAPIWWGGFVLCGIIIPLVSGCTMLFRSGYRLNGMRGGVHVTPLVACIVLFAAFALRFCIVEAGMHRELDLEGMSAQQTQQVQQSQQASSLRLE